MSRVLVPILAYSAFAISLFAHEAAHSLVAWRRGVAARPISVRFIPWMLVAYTPILDKRKLKCLERRARIQIHGAGIAANLVIWVVAGAILVGAGGLLHPALYLLLLLLMLANLAEAASYLTFGAIWPVSDVRWVLKEFPGTATAAIYLPGGILTGCLLWATTLFFRSGHMAVCWAFFWSEFVLLSSSRIVLTGAWRRPIRPR